MMPNGKNADQSFNLIKEIKWQLTDVRSAPFCMKNVSNILSAVGCPATLNELEAKTFLIECVLQCFGISEDADLILAAYGLLGKR